MNGRQKIPPARMVGRGSLVGWLLSTIHACDDHIMIPTKYYIQFQYWTDG